MYGLLTYVFGFNPFLPQKFQPISYFAIRIERKKRKEWRVHLLAYPSLNRIRSEGEGEEKLSSFHPWWSPCRQNGFGVSTTCTSLHDVDLVFTSATFMKLSKMLFAWFIYVYFIRFDTIHNPLCNIFRRFGWQFQRWNDDTMMTWYYLSMMFNILTDIIRSSECIAYGKHQEAPHMNGKTVK